MSILLWIHNSNKGNKLPVNTAQNNICLQAWQAFVRDIHFYASIDLLGMWEFRGDLVLILDAVKQGSCTLLSISDERFMSRVHKKTSRILANERKLFFRPLYYAILVIVNEHLWIQANDLNFTEREKWWL